MFFKMPVTVYSEPNCIRNHSDLICSLGTKALLVTGRHSAKKCGALQDVCDVLAEHQIPYVHFDEIEENPSVESVLKGRELGASAGVDFVIAIGGGSPLDAAKAIALLLRYPEKGRAFLYELPPRHNSFPLAAIPTTCGTGSEVTAYSVLTVHEKQTKVTIPHRIFPQISLVDPKYLKNAPLSLLQNTAMDALGHLLESGINSAATEFSRMFVKEGLSIWQKSKPVLLGLQEPAEEDFFNLMNASTLAGMAISHTGTSLPHGLSYCLTYDLRMAHGKAVGYFLGGYLRHAPQAEQDALLSLAGFQDVADLEQFYEKTCGKDTIPTEILEKTVDALLKNTAKQKCCPYPISPEILRSIAGL